jgi:hypothetical protein
MLIVMAKAKSKQKKGKQANVSKARKKSGIKKKSTSKVRNDYKKKATRRKASPRTKTRRVEKVPSPAAAFTEIASEEVTSPMPAQGEQEMLGSTESTGVGKSEFTSIDDNNNTNSI